MPEENEDPNNQPLGWLREELDAATAELATWPAAMREQTPVARAERDRAAARQQ